MGLLDGRVAIVTGAAQGIGREHATLFAAQGAAVLAADLAAPEETAAAIRKAGGRAVAVGADCSDWPQAKGLVESAVEAFGDLHVLVNNAGINRNLMFEDMEEAAWDTAITGNLSAAIAPTRAAVGYWRSQAPGRPVKASVISTASGAGLIGNVGQTHYGAAKAAVAAFTVIAAKELAPHGIRLNAVAPAARTPMSSVNPVVADVMREPDSPEAFDAWHPREIAPLAAYLASADCETTGRVFHVRGGLIAAFHGWSLGPAITSDRPWTPDEVAGRLPALVDEVERLEAARPAPNDDLRRKLTQNALARSAS